ncbi:DgyrCDS11965 [Dimorphilus gyrociliatus]|uniref:DgyrCDS11965 n=1 Tax=Dimorphilus gyrociliatus TaxID=2664684 RepID=A0A7I8W504_9ANNE|nr:DgyrCDS11965 [Dimorphilus gyrociliatus]
MSNRQSPVQEEEVTEESGVVENHTAEEEVTETQENTEEETKQAENDEEQVENEEDEDFEITVDESQSMFTIIECLTKEYEALKNTIESKNGEEIAEDSAEVKRKVKRLKRELKKAIAYQSKLSENQNFVDDINGTLQNLIAKVKTDNSQAEETTVEETEVAVKKAKSTKRLAEVAEELAQVQQLAAEYEQKVIDMEEKLTKVKNEAEKAENTVENSKTDDNNEEDEEKQRLEEEEREKREEEEKRQKEEEERRLEEERKRLEEKKKEEEERRKKLDPVSWPMFKIEGDDKIINSGLVCMIRAQDGAYSDGQIKGEMFPEASRKYPLSCDEEIVSNVIRVYCDGDEPVKFSKPIAIAIPLSLPRALPAREFVIKVLNTSPYKDLLTRDIIYPEYKEIRFADALFDEVRDLTLCVVSRFKKEKETFNNKGGKLVSTIDSRVSLTIPKRSLRLATELSLQLKGLNDFRHYQIDSTNKRSSINTLLTY